MLHQKIEYPQQQLLYLNYIKTQTETVFIQSWRDQNCSDLSCSCWYAFLHEAMLKGLWLDSIVLWRGWEMLRGEREGVWGGCSLVCILRSTTIPRKPAWEPTTFISIPHYLWHSNYIRLSLETAATSAAFYCVQHPLISFARFSFHIF